MKSLTLILIIAASFTGCADKKETNQTDSKAQTTETMPEKETTAIPQLKPVFTSLDENVSSHIKSIFNHYIHVKTALVNSDSKEAQTGAEAIVQVIRNFDKSMLPAEQKSAYDKFIGAIRASAGNISSTTDIEKQREHFAALSSQTYELAKSFGSGRPIYHEHCPMAFNDKGAMWLSESKDIKNPYYGDAMLECGTVEEIIE